MHNSWVNHSLTSEIEERPHDENSQTRLIRLYWRLTGMRVLGTRTAYFCLRGGSSKKGGN